MFACTPGSSDTLELDSEPAEAVRYVVLGQLLEYIAMGSGAFAYSIAWDREAWIVIAIRSVTRLFVDGFSVLANLILPPDWTRKDAYTIKLTFASALPILFVMRFLSLAPKVGGKRQFGSFDRMVAFQLLPMLTIPIIGTYFTVSRRAGRRRILVNSRRPSFFSPLICFSRRLAPARSLPAPSEVQ